MYFDIQVSSCKEMVPKYLLQNSIQFVHNRADSRFAPRQWETALLCNDISHWLGANLESALHKPTNSQIEAPWCQMASWILFNIGSGNGLVPEGIKLSPASRLNYSQPRLIVNKITWHGIHQDVNTLRQRQNGRHFADDTFKCIFLNKNARILIRFSLNFLSQEYN